MACNEHRLDGYGQERKPSTQESWHRFAETGEGIQRGGRPFDHLKRSGTAFTGCVKVAPHHPCAPADALGDVRTGAVMQAIETRLAAETSPVVRSALLAAKNKLDRAASR